MSIAGTLKDIESGIQYQMPLLVHIPHGPITKLAVVYDARMTLLSIAEGKGTTREFARADALHLALAHCAHSQRISHDRFEEARRIDGAEETFWKRKGSESVKCSTEISGNLRAFLGSESAVLGPSLRRGGCRHTSMSSAME